MIQPGVQHTFKHKTHSFLGPYAFPQIHSLCLMWITDKFNNVLKNSKMSFFTLEFLRFYTS